MQANELVKLQRSWYFTIANHGEISIFPFTNKTSKLVIRNNYVISQEFIGHCQIEYFNFYISQ